jgi:RNA polymerase sigma factor (TIGR02999 family)
MRQVLINHANRRSALKRGGGVQRLTLSDIPEAENDTVDFASLDDALTRLSERSQRQARIVEMRFFAGMTIREVAEVLNLSTTTVDDDWYGARAWLSRELSQST